MSDHEEVAKVALANETKIKAGFQKLLAEAGIQGWELVSFEIQPKPQGVKALVTCPAGQVYDCRWVNGRVVCGCFPSTP